MALPSTHRRASNTRRRKLSISKILTVFLFVTISICIISLQTYLSFSSSIADAGQQTDASKFQLLLAPQSSSSKSNVQTSGIATVAEEKPIVIAHAISLIKCSKSSSVTGFLDAAAILRHSIHKNSVHAKNSKSISRYSYQMYAIVHKSCAPHSSPLEKLGYTLLVQDHPVKQEDIKGEWLRNHIEGENCCGSAEFIKLYGKWCFNSMLTYTKTTRVYFVY